MAKQMDKAIELYEQAAMEFGRQHMYLYKALTLERAARFAMSMGDKVIGLRFLQDSYNEYKEYGAEPKTSALRKEHPLVSFDGPVPESVMMQVEVVEGFDDDEL